MPWRRAGAAASADGRPAVAAELGAGGELAAARLARCRSTDAGCGRGCNGRRGRRGRCWGSGLCGSRRDGGLRLTPARHGARCGGRGGLGGRHGRHGCRSWRPLRPLRGGGRLLRSECRGRLANRRPALGAGDPVHIVQNRGALGTAGWRKRVPSPTGGTGNHIALDVRPAMRARVLERWHQRTPCVR